MLAKGSNDFSTPIRKDYCRSNSCGSECLCCSSAKKHSVLSCSRSSTRPTIARDSYAWQKPSPYSLLACAAPQKRSVSSNARESCDSWLKKFWSVKIHHDSSQHPDSFGSVSKRRLAARRPKLPLV